MLTAPDRALAPTRLRELGTMNDPIVITPSLLERFWAKVDKNGPIPSYAPHLGPCWLWTAATNKKSRYGVFRADGKTRHAHSVSYEIHRGHPVPRGLEIDHLCRVRHCINPAHLEAVTRKVNIERGTAFQRRKEQAAAITRCIYGHEYTPENTYTRPNGNRACRECRRIERRRRRAEEKRRQAGQEVTYAPPVGDPHLVRAG